MEDAESSETTPNVFKLGELLKLYMTHLPVDHRVGDRRSMRMSLRTVHRRPCSVR